MSIPKVREGMSVEEIKQLVRYAFKEAWEECQISSLNGLQNPGPEEFNWDLSVSKAKCEGEDL